MGGDALKNYARFSVIAAQMGVTIFAGAYLGKWLDTKFPMDEKWFTVVFTILAVAISLFNVLRQVNKINKEIDEKKESSKKIN